ncbi:transposase [Flavobacterium sp. HJSW_4]|uniref:transposase n=1 Tax=Flavobacterium sp. HJSW_4 TaxID=3344660 RepID=UPI0035F44D70
MIRTVNCITAKEILRLHPEVKNKLWDSNFWTIVLYYVNKYGSENGTQKYIQNQGK